ncbi:MAG: preprotein translocase subunit SecA [Planctomycetia bacterium]|nr:preprotein translocase subunit SecA [Planctomycetia bacterium]
MPILSATVIPAAAPSTSPGYVKPAAPPNRLGTSLLNYIRAYAGILPWQRRLAWGALQVPRIRYWEDQYKNLTSEDLRLAGLRLRGRCRGGESLDKILPEAFGLVCVASNRFLQMRPYDVQLAAGVVMHNGGLAELATGEGKTLSASLPVFLNALLGKGVHVTTVNDYLARRDAELMKPIYSGLGLTVGALQQQMGEQDRQKAYKCDITYGTASEFGFDFLRDRLKVAGAKGQEQPFWSAWTPGHLTAPVGADLVQRGHHYALVDEADNIFVDEAKTPLVIAGPTKIASPEECSVYQWADGLARQMVLEKHFKYDMKKQKIELTPEGHQLIRWSNPPRTGAESLAVDKLHERLEQALHAHHRFRRDQHYMIDKDKIVIIDESTGRRMPDRHWREGLHQAVEAKEGVPIHTPSDHAAQITYQSYFRLYNKLSGMTGTAAQNWFELYRVYKLWVVCVPTNRPVIRKLWPDRVFPTEDAKFEAVVQEVKRLKDAGRAVLIGTRSVDKSEELSKRLKTAGIDHEVINARQHEQEAHIVEHAGEKGRVTIATNMAGRGTDIKPPPEVLASGGLHVLGTERHESLRIDRQLMGRAGRQGDPGTAQFFLSLDDELLEALTPERHEKLKARGRRGGNADWQSYLGLFWKAQARVEARHYRSRVDLMVHEKQRQEILKDLAADPYVD